MSYSGHKFDFYLHKVSNAKVNLQTEKTFIISKTLNILLVPHEYIVEGAVEEGVDEISETEVEDEEISDSFHSLVPWHYDVYLIYSKTIQTYE